MSIKHPTRRQFGTTLASSFGGLALTDLLASDGALSGTHHPARAKRVIQLFMAGAASHVDLFDYKPQLEKEQGQQCQVFSQHKDSLDHACEFFLGQAQK